MKIARASLVLLFFANTTFAQGTITVRNGTITSQNNFSSKQSFFTVYDGETIVLSEETKGSYYAFEEFMQGSILKNGVIAVENVYLNYNAYSDVFNVKENEHFEDKHANSVTKSPEFQIKIGNSTYIVGPHPEIPEELQYYKLIITGKKMHLVKMQYKIYKPGFTAPSGITRDIPASFIDKETFYVVDSDKNYRAIPSSRKKFLEMFGDQQEKLEKAIKNGKLKLDNEKDLARLIRYYNVL